MTKMSPKQIKTVADFVAAFGGTAELADFLDVGMPCVSNWKRDDAIPPGWHLRLFLEAQRRGISVPPEFFGVKIGSDDPSRPRKGRSGNGVQAAA